MHTLSVSIFYAKVFGLYMLPVGIGLLFDPMRFRKWYESILHESAEQQGLFGGAVALLIGGVMIASHNVWVFNWPIIITLIAWWAFIKGAALMIIPHFIKSFKPMVSNSNVIYRLSGIFWFLLGLFLLYVGYIAH